MLRTETIVSVPFDENSYILWLDGRDDCLIVDPGMQPGKIVEVVQQHGLTPQAVLLTHGHSDHIFGNEAMKQQWPEIPLIIGEGDAYKLTDPEANLSAGFGLPFTSPPADQTVVEGDSLDLAGMKIDVIETPGHSAGHVTFVIQDEGGTHLIAGDVLFRESIGRTDFFDGDAKQLQESIQGKFFPLPDCTIVYPGHGPTTTVGHEREFNPYVGAAANR